MWCCEKDMANATNVTAVAESTCKSWLTTKRLKTHQLGVQRVRESRTNRLPRWQSLLGWRWRRNMHDLDALNDIQADIVKDFTSVVTGPEAVRGVKTRRPIHR
jgi:hypothetical protein